MQNTNDFILGVLWHDIGKFKQRAQLPEDIGKNHIDIGVTWLEKFYGTGLITALVSTHHGSLKDTWESNLSLLGYEADNCSASERKAFDPQQDKDKSWHREISLANIFGRVRDPRRYADPQAYPIPSYLPLRSLGNWLEPEITEIKNDAGKYEKLWQDFEKEFTALHKKKLHHDLNLMLHLLEKYTATIPSITQKIFAANDRETYKRHPDISLFDHLKTAAALAHCLYHYHQEKDRDRWTANVLKEEITGNATWKVEAAAPFLIIGGDISGVQRFIYTISSQGALKSLKGRSFYLELFTEHLVDFLLKELQLSRCNIIFTGGGHFYLLAPNTTAASQGLTRVRQAANDYLRAMFNGVLHLSIEAVSLNKAELKKTGEVWSRLSASLEESKRRKWADSLEVMLADPAAPHAECYLTQCAICGREDRELETEGGLSLCPPCRDQYILGEKLQQLFRQTCSSVLAVWHEKPEKIDWTLGLEIAGFQKYYLPVENPSELQETPDEFWRFNSWELSDFSTGGSRPVLSATYHAPNFYDLEGLVNRGFGMGQAAVLRMDVDFLGRIFSHALGPEDDTLARKASLSRQLSLFFKYHLNGILRRSNGCEKLPRHLLALRPVEFPQVSVVYAGGDDLFLLGHWLDVLEAALDIHTAFQQYTANKFITVSAGLILAPVHFPLYKLGELAGQAEKEAKRVGGDEKNRIGFSKGQVFTWQGFHEDIQKAVDILLGLLESKGQRMIPLAEGVGTGFFYQLLQICREQKRQGPLKLPPLAWLFGRQKPRREKLFIPWQELQNWVFNTKIDWQGLEMAAMLVLMMMRKGDNQ